MISAGRGLRESRKPKGWQVRRSYYIEDWGLSSPSGAASRRRPVLLQVNKPHVGRISYAFCGLAPTKRAFAVMASRQAAAPLAAAQDASLRFAAFSTFADLSGLGGDDAGRRHLVGNVAPQVVAGVLLRRAASREDEKESIKLARKNASQRMREFLDRELGGSERCNQFIGSRVHFVASAILEDTHSERVSEALAELASSDHSTTVKMLLQRCNATELVLRSTSSTKRRRDPQRRVFAGGGWRRYRRYGSDRGSSRRLESFREKGGDGT